LSKKADSCECRRRLQAASQATVIQSFVFVQTRTRPVLLCLYPILWSTARGAYEVPRRMGICLMLCTALIYCRDQVKEIETFPTPAGQGVDELKITTILTRPTAPARCIIQAGTSCNTVIVPAHSQLPQTDIWIVSHSEISERSRLGNSASRSGLLNLGHAQGTMTRLRRSIINSILILYAAIIV
jgi:hypothetical protein